MLHYTGGGFGGSQPNIPARDLNEAEVREFGAVARLILGRAALDDVAALLALGIYAAPAPSTSEKKTRALYTLKQEG